MNIETRDESVETKQKPDVGNFPCQTLKISKVSLVMGS
jgi:hypothetical protein